jgi:hypothetical protein
MGKYCSRWKGERIKRRKMYEREICGINEVERLLAVLEM